ncbi:MAG: cytochrome C biosynthesis protein [Pseudonocardiales bacterium]|nr:cytochrome c-type biogenesis protein CcmH [Actinomycetota bacterium]PZS22032.1 MAG: cytochrome C biosynthesis protein [Pseudonocardiales bacterium]
MPRRAVNVGVAAAIVLLVVTAVGLLLGGTGVRDRASELQQRLRCPVCKSVSIDESQSQTAVAMRRAVAEQVAAGRGDAEIIDYFRARYGDWVLLDPPFRGTTALLWLLPAAATLVGVAILLARARRVVPPAGEISAADRARVATELARTRLADEEP